MPNLAWDSVWKTSADGFATLALFAKEDNSEGDDNEQETTLVTDSWDGTYTEPTQTDGSGNIIINTAEELAWAILKSGDASSGKTYKVADNIGAFYMNENTDDLTLAQVKNNLNGNNVNVWQYQNSNFQGTIDGNGVIIYGLYSAGDTSDGSKDGGFIPHAKGAVAVKNIAFRNSYFAGWKYGAAIITYAESDTTAITVEQCEVSNCYITQNRTTSSTGSATHYSVGVVCGFAQPTESFKVNNCLIYGNGLDPKTGENTSAIVAQFNSTSALAQAGGYQFSNIITSGVAPWCGNYSYWGRYASNYTNVYTDTTADHFTFTTKDAEAYPDGSPNDWCTTASGNVEVVSTTNMQGASAKTNMPNLAWNNVWKTSDNFPMLAIFDRGNSDEPEEKELNIIYWDGTSKAPDETKVDADGNIIISTAEELHYIATTTSSGKSYKFADGIDVIILQPEDKVDAETLMGLADYNAVKTYLTETITATAWVNYSADPPVFNSSFDGNGVEIYGLYGIGLNVGLFPGVDGGTVYTTDGHTGNTFQNFAVRNSYLESTRRLGVIGSYSAGGIGVGTVNVKNCEVSNCYAISTTTTESYFGEEGLLVGRTKDKEIVHIENCLVYGNYSYATGLGKRIPLYTGAYTNDANALSTVENTIVLGTEPYPTASTSSKTHAVDCFENVYTDQDLPTYTTYADTDIKKIDAISRCVKPYDDFDAYLALAENPDFTFETASLRLEVRLS